MALPTIDMADGARHRHLLVLPGDVGTDEVETLAVSRFPRAAWEVEPSTAPPRASGGRGTRPAAPTPGRLRLSRLSELEGPYVLDKMNATALGVPAAAGLAYVVHAPVERGPAPWPDGGDRDGLGRAFPEGLPIRDEERTIRWAVDVARRLGGAVRVARGDGSASAVLVPDPAAAVDLTIWTDIWLEPDAAVAVMRQALPRTRLNLPTATWSGPPAATGSRPALGAEVLTPEQRAALHAEAERRDIAALTDPEPMQAYGAIADLELDGLIALEVSGHTDLPPVMAGVPWAAEGAVGYVVRWEPADLAELEAERPDLMHKVARGRATPLVASAARALHRAVGGEITDYMGFIVDPADL